MGEPVAPVVTPTLAWVAAEARASLRPSYVPWRARAHMRATR